MVKINLLDWREELREKRRKRFFAVLILSALAAALTVLAGVGVLNERVDHQKARNDLLRREIAELDKQIVEIQELEKVKANLLARMRVIEKLQATRSAMVHFFDEIVNTLPEGVYLTSLKQTGDEVAIDGVAESNGRISTYMKNLEASQWFTDPNLVVIRTVERDRRRQSDFSLRVKNLTIAKLTAAANEADASGTATPKGGTNGGGR
ncbi:MAG TPA: PilN domain-containing protein [Nevskiaceae bacterium]|nr:PilN domain-containing protein [Nevskiaceae bacterium]